MNFYSQTKKVRKILIKNSDEEKETSSKTKTKVEKDIMVISVDEDENQEKKNIKWYEAELEKKPKKCPICSKVFTEARHCRSHIRSVHEGEKNFFCQTCGAGFFRRSGLVRHIQSGMIEKIRKLKMRTNLYDTFFKSILVANNCKISSNLTLPMPKLLTQMLDHNPQTMAENIIQTQQIALIPTLQDKVNRFECPYCDHIFYRLMDKEQHIRKGSELISGLYKLS